MLHLEQQISLKGHTFVARRTKTFMLQFVQVTITGCAFWYKSMKNLKSDSIVQNLSFKLLVGLNSKLKITAFFQLRSKTTFVVNNASNKSNKEVTMILLQILQIQWNDLFNILLHCYYCKTLFASGCWKETGKCVTIKTVTYQSVELRQAPLESLVCWETPSL